MEKILITDKSEVDLLQNKLNEITTLIFKNNSEQEGLGLLAGKSGISLFLFYYYKLSGNEKYSEKAYELLTECFDMVNNGYKYHTFCSGIAGFCWVLKHCSTNNFIDKEEINELLNKLDTFLFDKMIINIKTGNYDFLHGAVGIGIYFLERLEDNNNVEKYLSKLVDELEIQSHKDDDGSLKWLSVVEHETGIKGYNLSLSHGITSIIAFLGKMYEKNIYKEKINYLLNGSIKYLLKNMLDYSKRGFYFPGYINDNCPMYRGRLSWCYNDLGTAVVLFNVGKIINDEVLQKKGIEILQYNTNRKSIHDAGTVDAALCHGTAGIAHIYNRMYQNTGIEVFKETAIYWFDETLKMATHNDGLTGYKAWHGEKYGGWKNEHGILEGIAGIGLSIISAISDIEPKWDECLLLS